MHALGNDRWTATFTASELGSYRYTIEGWTDRFLSWRRDIRKWLEAGTDVSGELEVGARLVEAAASGPRVTTARSLRRGRRACGTRPRAPDPAAADEHPALDEALASLANAYPDRRYATRYERELGVSWTVRVRASRAWYEMFPRSCGVRAGTGTARSGNARRPLCLRRRDGLRCRSTCRRSTRSGATNRKGTNNALSAAAGRPGQPVGDRRRRGRPQGDPPASSARWRTSRASCRGARELRHRDRARHRLPVLARPSVGRRASGVVPPPARRHDPVRREPAEEVPGHLPVRLRDRRLAGAVGRAAERVPILDRAGRARSSASTTRTPSRSRSGSG